MILNLLNKTEETVKNGISISEIMLFYQKYNLRLRIINQFDMLVYFFNPTHFSKRNKPTYVLMKDNHVYNITYTESLEKKISKMQSINDDQFDIKISDNYRCDIVDYKDTIMIEDVKELITMTSKEKQTLYVILKDNDIDKALYKLKEDLGYTAGISFSDNRVNKLYCNFGKNITFIIQRQQLTSSPLGFSDVNIDNLQTYINMNHVMTDFHNQLFIKSYKSSYSDEDIQILDSYRTIVPCGKFRSIKAGTDLIELDVRKAFTSAFCKIKKAPVFNEFDNFIKYDNSDIINYALYIVSNSKKNLFFNNEINIVYGLFLKKLNVNKSDIKYYKVPSQLKDVNFKELIDKVYSSHISDDKNEDIDIKSLICNVSFGMLENQRMEDTYNFYLSH